jgi:hypothetical protein
MAAREEGGDTAVMLKHLAILVVVVPCVVSGCCGDGGGAAKITSATLSDWSEFGFAVIGGFVSGSAVMTTTDADGDTSSGEVGVGGPVVGIVFDVHVGGEGTDLPDCGGASLVIPEGGVSLDDIFGGYSGSATQVGMALGISEHDLENDAGVKLKGGGLSVGAGMFVGGEWVGLSQDGDFN